MTSSPARDGAAPTPVRRGPRADAVRNRLRVAEAAYDVFAEHGLDATVAQVAQGAQVGNATVFRHFPTKADLLNEVTARWLTDWAATIERRLGADGDHALEDLLEAIFERLRRDRFSLDVLRSGRLHPDVESKRLEVERLFSVALDRAVTDGRVRADITYADLSILVLGAAGQLAEFGDLDPARWRRHAQLVRAAIET